MTESGLRILSLDGGGVSALSELLIIKELMTRIQHEKGFAAPPRPCEWFHLIGGTGGGGLAAILLGRLRLGIGPAIECWVEIMEIAFKETKTRSQSETTYSATKLETAIGQIVEKYCGRADERMIKASGDEGCKVVVYALTARSILGGVPTSIRTYTVSSNQGPLCTIIEAVRATMATPGVFKPIIINDEIKLATTYIGGGLTCNNPTAQLLKEVEQAYPRQPVTSIISVGSGQLLPARVQSLPRLRAALETIVHDCETVNQDMSHRFRGHDGYYRFNVEQGMQYIDQYSLDQFSEANAHTQTYLQLNDPNSRMDKAVANLTAGAGPGTMVIQGESGFHVSNPHANRAVTPEGHFLPVTTAG